MQIQSHRKYQAKLKVTTNGSYDVTGEHTHGCVTKWFKCKQGNCKLLLHRRNERNGRRNGSG